jgi:hypothetical protein
MHLCKGERSGIFAKGEESHSPREILRLKGGAGSVPGLNGHMSQERVSQRWKYWTKGGGDGDPNKVFGVYKEGDRVCR